MGIMKRGFGFPPMGSLEGKCFVNLYKQLLFFISDDLQFIGFKRGIVRQRIALSNERVLT